jgi:hypothetical protein
MKIYIIKIEYLNRLSKEMAFESVSQEGYRTLQEAINFCKGRSDYRTSLNDFYHYGEYHNYVIKEITIK